ncbi:hypothetical protein EDI_077570, partial [Entamoeba dispar SAW760]
MTFLSTFEEDIQNHENISFNGNIVIPPHDTHLTNLKYPCFNESHKYYLRTNPSKRKIKYIEVSLKSHGYELLKISIKVIKDIKILRKCLIGNSHLVKDVDRTEYLNIISDLSDVIEIFSNINVYITANDN